MFGIICCARAEKCWSSFAVPRACPIFECVRPVTTCGWAGKGVLVGGFWWEGILPFSPESKPLTNARRKENKLRWEVYLDYRWFPKHSL